MTRFSPLALFASLLLTHGAAFAQTVPPAASDAISALVRAVEATPDDAAAHARLSQAHAAANEPAPARRAIERALALEPNNPEYVRAFAVLATWTGDYTAAAETYRTLLRLQPQDATIWLNLARVTSWAGETGQAADAYRLYLRAEPNDADVWLELATTESWRGNYTAALDALESYRSRFGDSSTEYALTLARVYAGAGRPSRAVALLDPLHAQDPGNYEVNLARTIALTMKRSVGDARASLASVRRIDARNEQTRDAERLVRATLGSSIQPQFTFYGDSDDLQTVGFTPSGSLMLSSGTRLSAGFARHVLSGSIASGLGRTDGASATHEQIWAELAQTLGPLTLSGRAGTARTDGRERTPYEAGARLRVADALTFGVTSRDGFVLISPRTLELGLTERRHQMDVVWSPTLRMSVLADASLQEFSDGNTRWEARVAPHWAVARTGAVNLDLGVAAYRLASDTDLTNGYWDPQLYESYQFTAYPYLKISENVGASFALAVGGQRERGLPFRVGGSGTAELTVGIYRAWLLRVGGGATNNFRQESGAFRGYAGSVALVKRF